MEEMRETYTNLVPKLAGKRPRRRHKCRWEDNIKINLKEFPCGDRGIRIVPP
jgi:hypothetical protein